MKWEHMTIALPARGFLGEKINPDELTARLDEAGESGWELVNVFTTSPGYGKTLNILGVSNQRR